MNNKKYFFKKIISFLALVALSNNCDGWSFLGINFGGDEQAKEDKPKVEPIIIMLDPAWDVKFLSRKIDSTNEFELSFKLAQELKKELENEIVQIIITKTPEAKRNNLSNANWANKIKADLYLNLQICHSKEKTKKLFVYHTIYNTSTDFWDLKQNTVTFLPYDSAYKINLKKTKDYANLFQNASIVGCPCKPLMGIISPALMIEMVIVKEADLQMFKNVLIDAIKTIINNIKDEKNNVTNSAKSQTQTLSIPTI